MGHFPPFFRVLGAEELGDNVFQKSEFWGLCMRHCEQEDFVNIVDMKGDFEWAENSRVPLAF